MTKTPKEMLQPFGQFVDDENNTAITPYGDGVHGFQFPTDDVERGPIGDDRDSERVEREHRDQVNNPAAKMDDERSTMDSFVYGHPAAATGQATTLRVLCGPEPDSWCIA